MPTFKLSLPKEQESKKEETMTTPEINNDNATPEVEQKDNLPELAGQIDKSKEDALKEKGLIIMDGPMSKIYEEALNIVYSKNNTSLQTAEEEVEKSVSKESAAIDTMLLEKYESASSNKGATDTEVPLYVYVTDSNDVNKNLTGNLSSLATLIRNRNNSDVIVAVESNSTDKVISQNELIFNNYCRSRKCVLFNDRDKCLKAIISSFKG